MDYREAIEFLFSSLPMFQRIGGAAYKANLDNTLALDDYFGHPHRAFPSIHVAGTNGKGSVSHMLASVYQEAGFRTGLYTSPHMLDFRERIRVGGTPVSEEEVVEFVTLHREIIDRVSPSFFEMTVAMAFDRFRAREVEMAVIEVGLGGRLDSTNIITPAVSVITNISHDHAEFLGRDLDSIAREKGGIIKPGVPVVLGKTGPETVQLLSALAHSLNAPVSLASQSYVPEFATLTRENHLLIHYRTGGDQEKGLLTVECGLSGQYQLENTATVLTVIDRLREMGWNLPERAVRQGIERVVENTGILGRWQTIGHRPRSICDTAHNQAGVEAAVAQVMQLPFRKLHMVWGMVSDKDIRAILPLLPQDASYYFTKAGIPRAMDADLLRNAGAEFGLKGNSYPTVARAYAAAMENAGPDDLVFTGGSTFVVADLLQSLRQA